MTAVQHRALLAAVVGALLASAYAWSFVFAQATPQPHDVPIGLAGVLLSDVITGPVRRDLPLIALALIVVGVVLAAADRFAPQRRDASSVGPRDALVLGCAQATALLPGVSRSGATISAGRLLGLTRPAATRLSFLMAVPAVLLSGAFTLPDVLAGDGPGAGPTAAAALVAFAVGYCCIAGLLRFVTRFGLTGFAVYRILLGAIVLIAVI